MKDALGGVQSVLLLGGGSQLGQATLQHLDLRPGSHVVLAGRSKDAMLAAAVDAGLTARPGVRVSALAWDAQAVAQHPAFMDEALALLGDLDLVIMAVGILGSQERAEVDVTHAVDVWTSDFVGPGAVLLLLARQLRRQGHGALVIFSSVAGLRGRRANFVYGAAKAGLDTLSQGLAAALAGSGARLVLVRPGFVHGRMTAGLRPAPLASTPDVVGRAVAAAIRGHADVVHVPRALGPLFALLRLVPAPLWRRLQG
jgi:decaprenylphospho-beta-D-erythro-pentofuranosid-2-ulose 2-reductase